MKDESQYEIAQDFDVLSLLKGSIENQSEIIYFILTFRI